MTCFQALVGAHPLPAGRLAVYLEKALREADLSMQIFERIRRKLRGGRDTMASYERQIRDLKSPKRAPKTEKGKVDRERDLRTLRKQLREVELVARLSESGVANRQDGDIESKPVKVTLPATKPVELVLIKSDQVKEEQLQILKAA